MFVHQECPFDLRFCDRKIASRMIVPPMTVGTLGHSASTRIAQIGASGVSRALMSAAFAEGTRLAPSASKTDAIAKTRPKASRIQISDVGTEKGDESIIAKGSRMKDESAAGSLVGVSGHAR